ncbi:hypothetical protein P9272_01765 [Mesorhizobium sp. WSM4976]|uniref:hypothetical protein n=1 Tax=Mesorhizobium sp. WSM4976 TaxID=3038549 RepID=UPI002415B3FB|nr:hypothetical protein [Mesorhizobium sp. WSM4976]MDG4892329.1 hypothetical protein [Mesorhizobium sp. WSM4976]
MLMAQGSFGLGGTEPTSLPFVPQGPRFLGPIIEIALPWPGGLDLLGARGAWTACRATRVATLALPPASLESGRRLLHDLAAFGDADDANKPRSGPIVQRFFFSAAAKKHHLLL